MRFWQSVLSILLVVFVLVVGLIGMAVKLDVVWTEIEGHVDVIRLFMTASGVSVWVLALLYLLTGGRKRKNKKYLTFDNEGGSVSISTEAIADYVSKLAGEFPSIVTMKPVIKPARRHMDVMITLKVKPGSQISDICELLQQRVRESIGSGLGIDEVGKVEVSVEEIASEHIPG